MDVLADADDILEELGVHFEHSAERGHGRGRRWPPRSTIRCAARSPAKSTVGTNVASDALANLASGGVTGGALRDRGRGLRRGLQRSCRSARHAFAMKSQIWLLDPRPNLPTIVDMVEKGFELSEASNTPVMLELRIRACHVHGRFTTARQPSARLHARAMRSRTRSGDVDRHRAAAGELSCTSTRRSSSAGRRRSRFIAAARLNEFFAERRARTSASSCRAACTTR
jgi:indolepyruvate ferredoxin oxidoreductase alpha subunit